MKTETKCKSIGHYRLGAKLGSGAFGIVSHGIHILTSVDVAIKVLEKERIKDRTDIECVTREIHILKLIKNPHVIQLFEVIESTRQLYIILEYAPGGELFDYIVQRKRLDEQEACKLFRQIVTGVEAIHKACAAHRDLKPENLLLDGKGNIKIVDFGLSNTFDNRNPFTTTACGSPCYAAPEMINNAGYNPICTDIWAIGVILFAMVCGYLPFEDSNTAVLYRKISTACFRIPSFVSSTCAELLRRILCTDANYRISLTDIKKTKWYTGLVAIEKVNTRPAGLHQFGNSMGCGVSTCAECKKVLGTGTNFLFDEQLIAQMTHLEFPLDYVIQCLRMDKRNHATTTYKLLLQKRASDAKQLQTPLKDHSYSYNNDSTNITSTSLNNSKRYHQDNPSHVSNGPITSKPSRSSPVPFSIVRVPPKNDKYKDESLSVNAAFFKSQQTQGEVNRDARMPHSKGNISPFISDIRKQETKPGRLYSCESPAQLCNSYAPWKQKIRESPRKAVVAFGSTVPRFGSSTTVPAVNKATGKNTSYYRPTLNINHSVRMQQSAPYAQPYLSKNVEEKIKQRQRIAIFPTYTRVR